MAEEKQAEETAASKIDRLVILVHPCAYENYRQPKPGSPDYPYLLQEQAALARAIGTGQGL